MHEGSPHFPVGGAQTAVLDVDRNDSVVKTRVSPKASAKGVFQAHPKTHTLLGIQIVAGGAFVPDQVVTNADMEKQYGIDPGWVEQRTGILERRHLPEGLGTAHMCVEAARAAMKAGRVSADEIDLIVIGTFTPDYTCPSVACQVQDALGIQAPAFDVQAACSGFMYALVTAAQFVANGNSRMALVIGGDAVTRVVDPQEKKIAPLFGDGAGAVLLTQGDPHQGLMCYQLGADGSGCDLLKRDNGGSLKPATPDAVKNGEHYLDMDGRSVFKWAVRALTDTIELVLNRTGMGVRDVDLFLVHQANMRIINYAAEQLGIPKNKMLNNLHKYGNTSAASVPLSLDEALRSGRIRRGDTVLLSGFGAGLTWGTALFRW